jgi:hypothetical protein
VFWCPDCMVKKLPLFRTCKHLKSITRLTKRFAPPSIPSSLANLNTLPSESTSQNFKGVVLKVSREVIVFVGSGNLQGIRCCWIRKLSSSSAYWITCSRDVVGPDLGAIACEAERSLRCSCDGFSIDVAATTTRYSVVAGVSSYTMDMADESALACR